MEIRPDWIADPRMRKLQWLLAGDRLAPIYVLRLWGECQSAKSDRLPLTTRQLAAVCDCVAHSHEAFERALIDAGWLVRDGKFVRAEGFLSANGRLVASWRNGILGGRPGVKTGPKSGPKGSARQQDERIDA